MQTNVILVRKYNFAVFVENVIFQFWRKNDSMTLGEKVI